MYAERERYRHRQNTAPQRMQHTSHYNYALTRIITFSRCLTSKYEDGSSNMYTSAFCTTTTEMANRCNSPPLRTCEEDKEGKGRVTQTKELKVTEMPS
jgi:hypothetical protein